MTSCADQASSSALFLHFAVSNGLGDYNVSENVALVLVILASVMVCLVGKAAIGVVPLGIRRSLIFCENPAATNGTPTKAPPTIKQWETNELHLQNIRYIFQ